MDTVFDREGRFTGHEVTFMKAAYLLMPWVEDMRGRGLTDTQIIDSCEVLRKKGLISLVKTSVGVRMELTRHGCLARKSGFERLLAGVK